MEPDSLLLYLTVLRDSEGQYGGPYSTILSKISERSPAPLLSAVNTQWNRGPVGGSSSRSDEHGRAGGRLVRRVLEGANPDAIPIAATPAPVCQLDWRALKRVVDPRAQCPGLLHHQNRPPQIWRDYFWEFLGLLTVIVLQFAMLWLVVKPEPRTTGGRASAARAGRRGGAREDSARWASSPPTSPMR